MGPRDTSPLPPHRRPLQWILGGAALALLAVLAVLILRDRAGPSAAAGGPDPAGPLASRPLPVPAAVAAPASVPDAATAPAPPAATAAVPLLNLSQWLAGHSKDWRVARLQEDPAILVIEFPDLAAQGAAMNRIAALIEKAGAPRDQVLDDAALAALIERSGDNAQTFFQGHDYADAALARFFALARLQDVALGPAEERLRGVLKSNGLLDPDPARPQALITFTAVQPDDPSTAIDESVDERRRESVLRHEYSHGRYFTHPAYREHCRQFWRQALTEAQRESIRRFLGQLGYDSRNEELMLNEAQALLMHTPDERAFTPAAVGISPAQHARLRERFWQGLPPDEASARLAGAAGRAPMAGAGMLPVTASSPPAR